MSTVQRNHDDYTVGWICSLEVEHVAAVEMLDEEHTPLKQPSTDNNAYTLGSIQNHNVVIAGLPTTGNSSAATVIAHMRSTFPRLRFSLLVGIGGGVPTRTDTGLVKLGDVVVSEPTSQHSGAIQYDRGKAEAGEFKRTGCLATPPNILLNAARKLAVCRARARKDSLQTHLKRIDTTISGLRRFKYPGSDKDHLYRADYLHSNRNLSCEKCGCDAANRIERFLQDSEDEEEHFEDTDHRVVIHRGTIASGELVMRDGEQRDKLAKEHDVLCFEMEAAGALNDFPCLVIRGISDYSDSHKNNKWHGYAAATAAAYARELFYHMTTDEVAYCKIPESVSIHEADQLVRLYYYSGNHLYIKRLSGEELGLEKCYINLALTDRSSQTEENEKGQKTSNTGQSIPLSNLFESKTLADGKTVDSRRIFIQGRAGIGKTTLCKKIVYDFLEGRLGSKLFDRILWIPLPRLKSREKYGWQELLQDTFRMSNQTWKEVKDLYGNQFHNSTFLSRTLFLFDGLDEILHQWEPEDPLHLFLNTILRGVPNVIITSRLYANIFSLESFDLDLKMIGFTVDQVFMYIRNCVMNSETVTEMEAFIAAEPLIQEMLRIPVQLDAFCYTWHEDPRVGVASPRAITPKASVISNTSSYTTMTTLYQSIMIELCRKDLRLLGRLGQHQRLLPMDIEDRLKQELALLGEIAFQGLFSIIVEFQPFHWNKLVKYFYATTAEVSTMFRNTLDRLSFLRTSDYDSDYTKRSYHFIHLTFQEFFAARHFTEHWQCDKPLTVLHLTGRDGPSSKTPLAFLQEEKDNPRYDVFWRFVTGLLHTDDSIDRFLALRRDRSALPSRSVAAPQTTRNSTISQVSASEFGKTETLPTEFSHPQKIVRFKRDESSAALLTSGNDETHKAFSKAQTQYSMADHEEDRHEEHRIKFFVDFLYEQMLSVNSISTKADADPDALQESLRRFAMRLGTLPGHELRFWAMKFIDKHRATIASILATKLCKIGGDTKDDNSFYGINSAQSWRDTVPDPSAEEKVAAWNTATVENFDIPIEESALSMPADEGLSDDDSNSDRSGSDDDALTQFLLSVPNTEWLVLHLQRDLTMLCVSLEEKQTLHNIVISHRVFPLYVSSRKAPRIYERDIFMDWHLKSFVDDQAEGLKRQGWSTESLIRLETLEHAITVTGSTQDAQALRCGDYLDQVWPDMGREILSLVKIAARDPSIGHDLLISNGVKIKTIPLSHGFRFVLRGTIYAIAEIVEVLGWLSSAFQPTKSGTAYCCSPRLAPRDTVEGSSPAITCALNMTWEIAHVKSDDTQAACWHKFFHSPLIVLGYPIAQKKEYNTGLECSLSIIDMLMQGPHISILDNQYLFIKNMSTILIPTGHNSDYIQWHYVYHEDGSYIDFLESGVAHVGGIANDDLIRYRHLIGWCPRAVIKTGGPWLEGHNVGFSGLDRPPPKLGIKTFSLGCSYMGFSISVPISIGVRDIPVWVEPKYKAVEDRLSSLSDIFVVLWDTLCATPKLEGQSPTRKAMQSEAMQSQRGWLLDGISALLYLLRAALEARRQEWQDTFKLQSHEILEPHLADPTGNYPICQYPEAAKEFFTRKKYHNLSLVIHEGVGAYNTEHSKKRSTKGPRPDADSEYSEEMNWKQSNEFTTVNDEFLRLWSILKHLSYRSKMYQPENAEGVEFSSLDFKRNQYLLGWEFQEIVKPATDIESQVAVLRPDTKPWIGLVKTISTVNLFGKGFGELIQANTTVNHCAPWSTVPTTMNYLVVDRVTIQKILKDKRCARRNFQLSARRPPSKRFCSCTTVHLHTIVQPRNRLQKESPQSSETLADSENTLSEAIIFGISEPEPMSKTNDDTQNFTNNQAADAVDTTDTTDATDATDATDTDNDVATDSNNTSITASSSQGSKVRMKKLWHKMWD